jgi:hypothetical protein
MELRGLLVSLQPTVDAGSICRMYGADLDDLKLLAIVEEELKRLQPKATKGTVDYGERH